MAGVFAPESLLPIRAGFATLSDICARMLSETSVLKPLAWNKKQIGEPVAYATQEQK